MNGHFWTHRLLLASATVALVGNVALVPATAFASPTAHTTAVSSRGCHQAAF
ncbi:hypothetical protein [Streptomyces sp. NPDC059909]|uniref:hypothetical protein n=1 Tax=Streptomyces sp. NPDC059909 TaxID=3346998 RepID=UPI0036569042